MNSALFFLCFFAPAVVAIAVLFWTWLVSFLSAYGNRQWLWGTGILVLLPLLLPYCLLHREAAAYPRRLLLITLALLVPPLLYAASQGWLAPGAQPPALVLPLPAPRAG